MNERGETQEYVGEDPELVDLVSAALADPNLHTDLRMRLSQEIAALLLTTHDDLYGPAGGDVHQSAREADGNILPGLLHDVLVDPNLHTDLRMRLHRDIPEIVRAVREHADGRTEGPLAARPSERVTP